MIVFQTNPNRALQALLYLAMRRRVTWSEARWRLLTADALHLNRNGRPVTGDQWDAETYGPMPRFLRRLMDGEASAVNLICRAGENSFRPRASALTLRDGVLIDRPLAERASLTPSDLLPDISESDRAALEDAINYTEAAVEMRDRLQSVWRDNMPGPIDYAELLFGWDDAAIAELRADSRRIVM